MASSLSASSSNAEMNAYLRSVQRRANDLFTSLTTIDLNNPNLSISDLLHRLSLLSTQSSSLIDEALFSYQWANIRNKTRNSILQPLIAGYNPSDQARVKLIPEEELLQSQALNKFNENQNTNNNSNDDNMNDNNNTNDTDSLSSSSLIEQINSYHNELYNLKAFIDKTVSEIQSSQSQAQISQTANNEENQRRESDEAEQIKRVMRVMRNGRGLRIE